MMRMDPNGTIQSYNYRRTGSFYSITGSAVLGLGQQYGGPGNVPCSCTLYGFAFMSEFYTEDLTAIRYLYTSNRGKERQVSNYNDFPRL